MHLLHSRDCAVTAADSAATTIVAAGWAAIALTATSLSTKSTAYTA